jgi:hypothetical protein
VAARGVALPSTTGRRAHPMYIGIGALILIIILVIVLT